MTLIFIAHTAERRKEPLAKVMVQLLHGRLDVTIYEVDTLQTQTLPGCNFNLCNKVLTTLSLC
jgi:hypothetical protein